MEMALAARTAARSVAPAVVGPLVRFGDLTGRRARPVLGRGR